MFTVRCTLISNYSLENGRKDCFVFIDNIARTSYINLQLRLTFKVSLIHTTALISVCMCVFFSAATVVSILHRTNDANRIRNLVDRMLQYHAHRGGKKNSRLLHYSNIVAVRRRVDKLEFVESSSGGFFFLTETNLTEHSWIGLIIFKIISSSAYSG